MGKTVGRTRYRAGIEALQKTGRRDVIPQTEKQYHAVKKQLHRNDISEIKYKKAGQELIYFH